MKTVRWNRELLAALDRILGSGEFHSGRVRDRILAEFGEAPSIWSVSQRIRAFGIKRRVYKLPERDAFLAFAKQNPGIGPYFLARMFNEQHRVHFTKLFY